jgi:hypothetical protein
VRIEVIEAVDAFAAAAGDLLATDEAHHTALRPAPRGAQRAVVRGVFMFAEASNPTSSALCQCVGLLPIGRHLHRVLQH